MRTTSKAAAMKKSESDTVINLEDMLNTVEAANYLGVSPRTVEDWRARLVGPDYFKPEGTSMVLYRVADIKTWIANSRIPGGKL